MMATHKANSQISLVLKHLKSGASIEPLEAWELYGIYRLGACIEVLRKEGYPIYTELVFYEKDNGRKGHYAKYTMGEDIVDE